MTVLGLHTAAELRDWLAAIDHEVHQVAAAHDAFAAMWAARDNAAAADWANDWASFAARYNEAHAKAKDAIDRAARELAPDSVIPAEDAWSLVDRALKRTPGVVSKGDLQDLYARLVAAQGKPVDLSNVPQPTATDADLGAFKVADAAVRAGENAVRKVTPSSTTGALLVVGAGLSIAFLLALRSVIR